jgi:hypothetical protein
MVGGRTVLPSHITSYEVRKINPLNAELNPIFHLLALLGSYHILYVSRVMVKTSLLPGKYFTITIFIAATTTI